MSQADQQIIGQIRENIDDSLLESAQEHDVDAEEIIAQQAQKRDGYGPDTIARFATSAIERKVEAEAGETISGIIMGCRQDYGTNRPRRHSLVRSDGEHAEVSTWDGSLPGPDGSEAEIPVGSATVEFVAEYQQDYDSWQGEQISDMGWLDMNDTVKAMSSVAIKPSDIGPGDEYDVVVVRGEIKWINPQTVFDGDDQDDWYDGPVLMEDSRGQARPHFEIVLDAKQGTRFRGHLQRQGNGRPFLRVPDLDKLTADAYAEFEEPDGQAQFVEDGLHGTDVILVGTVSGFDTDRDGEGEPVNYVDMNVSAIVAAGHEYDVGQEVIDDTPVEVAEAVESAGESAGDATDDAVEEDDGESPDGDGEYECECGKTFDSPQALNGHKSSCDEAGSDDGADDDPSPPTEAVAEVAESIEQYESLTDESLESVDEVREKLKGIGDSYDDITIRAAVKGDADWSAQPEEGSLEAVLEPYFEGGTYNCPDDDCLGSAGSVGELGVHAADEHDLSGYEGPEAFLKAKA